MESILLEDNPHWRDSQAYSHFIPRHLLPKALRMMNTREILTILGARRVGKSTLARLIIQELMHEVDARNIFFINLEKPEFIPYKNDPAYLTVIYDQYLKLANPNRDETIYFFMDEVQIFHHWEVFVKSKYESSRIKFVITGSNASLLRSDYATLLTGRVMKLHLYPFSFLEYLDYRQIPYHTRLEQTAHRIEIAQAKDAYLHWGGYFSVMAQEDPLLKKEYLQNIAEDIIFKDIVPRYKIKNSSQIHDLFFYLVSNATSTLNYRKLSAKIGIDPKMIKEYITYFEENYLLSTVSAYHHKITAQIRSAKKIYLNDNGLMNRGVNRSQNYGNRLENWVFNLLDQTWGDVTYISDPKEIDFFTRDMLVQVSYDLSDEVTRRRELGAFEKHSGKKFVITYDTEGEEGDVTILPIERFVFEYCMDHE